MVYSVLRTYGLIANTIRHCKAANNVGVNLLKTTSLLVQTTRSVNFYNSKTTTELWKTVTSVSNAGRRRGRGKGLTRRVNLYHALQLGKGRACLTLPGLNCEITPVTPFLKLSDKPKIIPMKKWNESKGSKLPQKKRRQKESSLMRGWTSAKYAGTKLGPPDPVNGELFEGFQSTVLEVKAVQCMTGNLGRKRRSSCMVVTGNGNGVAGFGMAKLPDLFIAIHAAKNRAGRKLMYIERHNEHTVLHDFYTQFGSTKIFVRQMPKGTGLVCHRIIAACCEAIGIKDLYAKVEGSTNAQHIVKAFFIGLLTQKSYQSLADEKQLYVVEFRKEKGNFPTVLAKPTVLRSNEDIGKNERLDVTDHIMDGKVQLRKPPKAPFYEKLASYDNFLRKNERLRNQDLVRTQLVAEYGKVRSFLSEKYPEAQAWSWLKQKEDEATE